MINGLMNAFHVLFISPYVINKTKVLISAAIKIKPTIEEYSPDISELGHIESSFFFSPPTFFWQKYNLG